MWETHDSYLDDAFEFDFKEYGYKLAFGIMENNFRQNTSYVADEDYGTLSLSYVQFDHSKQRPVVE